VRDAENSDAICEPIVQTMWDPQHLPTLRASTAPYGDSFTCLSVDDALTSQEAHASTASYGNSFTF
jgi:hypothetical protein